MIAETYQSLYVPRLAEEPNEYETNKVITKKGEWQI